MASFESALDRDPAATPEFSESAATNEAQPHVHV